MCSAHLAPVLETLEYIRRETLVWLEVTNLLIPGLNDSDAEIDAMTRWMDCLGPILPCTSRRFTSTGRCATGPDACREAPATPGIALANRVRNAYTGKVSDPDTQSTWCDVWGRC